MRIDLQIDSAPLVLRLQNGQRRLAYAVVNAINNTAKRIQAAERRRVEQEFTVRKKEFIRREAAVIKPFASVKQGRPYAEIGVGQKPRLLLSAFERGAERKPFTPGRPTRRPSPWSAGPPARSSPSWSRPNLRVGRLRFDRTKTGRRRRAAPSAPRPTSYPRSGSSSASGPRRTRLVYVFTHGKKTQTAPPLRRDSQRRKRDVVPRGDGAGGYQRDRAGEGEGAVKEGKEGTVSPLRGEEFITDVVVGSFRRIGRGCRRPRPS